MTNDDRRCAECGTALEPAAQAVACAKCLLAAGFESGDGGARSDALDRAAIESRFPDMEILSELGRGGMGVVYKARQKTLDRVVALKVLRGDVADDPRFEIRFTREARALARLAHPNIVAMYEFGERDGLFFFVMEFVDGTNLRQAMGGEHLPPSAALAIVPQICDALQFAHEQGVVHRDIKPENILIDRAGRVKIADFGLAKLVTRQEGDRTLTRAGLVMGTPQYMAPEQIEKPSDVDHRADIYSLGVVIYEMLTGELPLGRFASPSEKSSVDARVDAVVLRALEKELDRRYQRVSEVKTGIEEAGVARPPLPAVPQEVADSRQGPTKLSRLALWGALATPIAAALLVVVALGAWVLLPANGTDRGQTVGFAVVGVSAALILVSVLVGIALSAAALVSISRSGGTKRGQGLAIAGLLLPLLCCLPLAGFLYVTTASKSPLPASAVPNEAPSGTRDDGR